MNSIIFPIRAQGTKVTCLDPGTWHDPENDEAVVRWIKDVGPAGARGHGFRAAGTFANPLASDAQRAQLEDLPGLLERSAKHRDDLWFETPGSNPWNDASDRPIEISGVAITLRLQHSSASAFTGNRTRPRPPIQREAQT